MTAFVIIHAREQQIELVDLPTVQAAYSRAGLNAMSTDHRILCRPWEGGPGVAYVVYEYSFFMDRDEQFYFAFGQRLIAGNAVLYGFDEAGETVDMPPINPPRWFVNADEVEAAIEAREIVRPRSSAIDWEWPQPAPQGFPTP